MLVSLKKLWTIGSLSTGNVLERNFEKYFLNGLEPFLNLRIKFHMAIASEPMVGLCEFEKKCRAVRSRI